MTGTRLDATQRDGMGSLLDQCRKAAVRKCRSCGEPFGKRGTCECWLREKREKEAEKDA